MGNIQSDLQTAANIAGRIVAAGNSILISGQVTKDSTSSYQGNTTAGNLLTNEAVIAQSISTKIGEFVNLVHSLAQEFDAKDSDLSKLFENGVNLRMSGYGPQIPPSSQENSLKNSLEQNIGDGA
ncbi:TIGR04197 family type VII secretion effector [Streptococcus sanguinis]|uniref:TIGR04197 family type VII secretion effector n=1 Tax=Streptococcus sanguinis TaxID=1305 RepID=UPI002283DFD7|nr:TIGR04197 family type VII secretion effector [Streptococcus sanguinis]MCY7022587.1 TIGR04197 family type VII secretion effector [Streptococcus sanguinis]